MHESSEFRGEVNPVINPLGDKGLTMRQAGFAVLPAKGKSPKVKFATMKYAPGEAAIAKWAERSPADDLVYVPGMSGPKGSRKGIIVVDGDDAAAVEQVKARFGDTPGKVNTRRGKHFLYRAPGLDIEAATGSNITSLKKFGINADLKHGRSIVVAPPSWHEKDPSFGYTWDGCDERVIDDLPQFDLKALQDLINNGSTNRAPNVSSTARPRPSLFRDGSRKLGLNDFLVKQAWAFESFDDLLEVAVEWNQNLTEVGLPPMDADEVMTVAKAVWADLEKGLIERRHRQRATCMSDADEVRYLLAAGQNGSDALGLLMLFRAEHAGREKRSETFMINPNAMAKANTTGDWSPARIRKARDLLINLGFVEKVAEARRGFAAQYRLRERILTASLDQREAARAV